MKTLQLYDSARRAMLDGTMTLGKDAFKVSLMPPGFTFDSGNQAFADLGSKALVEAPMHFQVVAQSGGFAQVTASAVALTPEADGSTSWAVISRDGYGNGVANPLLGAIYLGPSVQLAGGYSFILAFPNQVLALG